MRRAILVAVFLLSSSAFAGSGALWSERAAGVPLAQVPDLSALAEQVVPCVVSIQVEAKVRGRMHDPFRDFFGFPFGGPGGPGGQGEEREFRNRGLGSGFIISGDGFILTNAHVVESADSIEVSVMRKEGGEKKLAAKVVGTAPEYDIALLQAEGNGGANVCYLGDSEAMRIGDWVVAVGNPFGLSHSMSVGIISAKNRRDVQPSGRAGYYNFLQTDAAINPGNSGGPLVNMRGEVIGINSAINAAGSGIGFAIPINMVKAMLPDLQKTGKFTRSQIGIKIQEVTDELAQSYKLDAARGALVSEVLDSSPASKAGLKPGDIILSFDGRPVRYSSDLPLYTSMAGVGTKVALELWRDGRALTKIVVLAAMADQSEPAAQGGEGEASGLGIIVADITPELQRELELPQAKGVVIRQVEMGSLAMRAGLRPGDIVMTLNDQPVGDARAFATRVKKLKSGDVLKLQLKRPNGQLFLALRMP